MKEKVPDGVSYFLCLSLSQAATFMACLDGGGRREAEGKRLKLAKNKLFTVLYFSYLSRIIIAWNVLRITLGVWHKRVPAHTWWNSSFNELVSMVKIAPMVTLTVRLSFSPVLLGQMTLFLVQSIFFLPDHV